MPGLQPGPGSLLIDLTDRRIPIDALPGLYASPGDTLRVTEVAPDGARVGVPSGIGGVA